MLGDGPPDREGRLVLIRLADEADESGFDYIGGAHWHEHCVFPCLFVTDSGHAAAEVYFEEAQVSVDD